MHLRVDCFQFLKTRRLSAAIGNGKALPTCLQIAGNGDAGLTKTDDDV